MIDQRFSNKNFMDRGLDSEEAKSLANLLELEVNEQLKNIVSQKIENIKNNLENLGHLIIPGETSDMDEFESSFATIGGKGEKTLIISIDIHGHFGFPDMVNANEWGHKVLKSDTNLYSDLTSLALKFKSAVENKDIESLNDLCDFGSDICSSSWTYKNLFDDKWNREINSERQSILSFFKNSESIDISLERFFILENYDEKNEYSRQINVRVYFF